VHDITRRKALERSMRRSEALFRATFDQALLGIVHTDLEGRFIRVNRRACEQLGYTEDELLALGYLEVTHPEDLTESAAHHQRLLAHPKEPFEYQVTRRYLRKDGSVLWALASVGVIRDDDGMPEFFLTMVQDITELKKVEEMKNEFVSTVSHELRSPLTSIRGSLGLLAGGAAGPLPKAAHDLAVIGERNCERLIRLVNDILDTERMEAGRMRFELQRSDLGSLAARAIEAMQGYALGRKVELRLLAPARPLAAEVDPDRFIQVLTNLVSNAVKFSPPASRVEIAVLEHDGNARIEVRDHGPGIPDEFRDRVFQRFAQADASSTRAAGGTGLGLYIAKGIVERFGGTIGFETAAGRGTTFHVELPGTTTAPALAAPRLAVSA
jgi:PAS domain S-box-containing protein